MIKNIKTDIIYYNSQKDFEFEFTLCAACRMRLLTDIAADRDSLLLSLARSVSRSQIVILYSDLTDDFVRTIAEAIGYKTEELDYDTYGITFYENRASIENAVPLVTDEGRFGGLILESGPQSLILVSSDKAIAKEIMKNYVYQYIKDVSEISSDVVSMSAVTESQEENVAENTEEIYSNNPQNTEEQNLSDTKADKCEEEPETVVAPNTEPQQSFESAPYFMGENIVSTTFDNYENHDVYYDEDAVFETDEPSEKKVDITSIILTVIMLGLVGFIVYLLVIEPLSNGISVLDNLKNLFGF